jgi:hypothetical protein
VRWRGTTGHVESVSLRRTLRWRVSLARRRVRGDGRRRSFGIQYGAKHRIKLRIYRRGEEVVTWYQTAMKSGADTVFWALGTAISGGGSLIHARRQTQRGGRTVTVAGKEARVA